MGDGGQPGGGFGCEPMSQRFSPKIEWGLRAGFSKRLKSALLLLEVLPNGGEVSTTKVKHPLKSGTPPIRQPGIYPVPMEQVKDRLPLQRAVPLAIEIDPRG